jgi:UDP-N-acetylglucosamine 2-epimerase (non-hydrolysing)
MTIVGTRPELIRLSRIIPRIDDFFDHVLVHTGQNYDYELNRIFFDELGIRSPDIYLEVGGGTAAESIAKIIERIDETLESVRPDAILILGDTNSGLSALPAKRRHIPIFHMEAGNRCFDFRVPEEINRRIIDHISDINLPYTENARQNLLKEGIPSNQVLVTGSPLTEVIEYYRDQISQSRIQETLKIEKFKYLVTSVHREENVDSPQRLGKLITTLNEVVDYFNCKMILSVHPRTKARLEEISVKFDSRIIEMKPLGFFDYINLQKHSMCVLSDSGTITEESSILGFPAVTLRHTHERPEGMDSGVLVMTGIESNDVISGIRIASENLKQQPLEVPSDYHSTNVSWKIVKALQSYVPFVSRETWSNLD